MPNLRERLARELCATYCEIFTCGRCERCTRWNKEHMPELADAALRVLAEALQEPSEAMRDAGWDEGRFLVLSDPDAIIDGAWARMLAAWLRENNVKVPDA